MSDNSCGREMTLAEWVDKLPETHQARQEFADLGHELAERKRIHAWIDGGEDTILANAAKHIATLEREHERCKNLPCTSRDYKFRKGWEAYAAAIREGEKDE